MARFVSKAYTLLEVVQLGVFGCDQIHRTIAVPISKLEVQAGSRARAILPVEKNLWAQNMYSGG